jgi:RNA polymerase sigma-70 factor, ECF subfamily
VRTKNKSADGFLEEMVALLPRLWRFALSLSRQKVLAEDLVQQACERALERRGQFTPGTRLDHWMFAILSNLWKNHLRAEKIRRGLGSINAEDLWDDGQIARAEEAILMSQLQQAVLELPSWQREPVVLVYVEQVSYKEAAAILDLPLGTVMSRLAAAKTALAARLNPLDAHLPESRAYHG